MDRPVTSKSRGICRYYTTPRGCFAGDNCKFLHGAEEKLTPYDKAKVCKYYARGHCTRGDRCWFRHVLPKVAPDDERTRFNAETCCICLEKPNVYGLLTDCSHVFCLECIRQWRAPAGKLPDVISSGTIKCCPLCRTPSRFATPSAHFFPNGNPRKQQMIDAYKASMAKVPCKYFEETSRTGKPCCPFGTDCFYQHANSDGTPYVFRHGARHSMNVYRRHRLRGAGFPATQFDYDDPIQFLQRIFENPITNLHATLDVIRASLPALMEGLASSNGPRSHDSGEEEDAMDSSIDPLELLDNSSIHDEAALSPPTSREADDFQATTVELPPEHELLPMQTPPLPETRTTARPQPARLSPRSSMSIGAHNRQTFIIDISDEEEEEEEYEEEEQEQESPSDAGTNNSIESSDSLPLASTPVTPSSLEQQGTTPQPVADIYTDLSFRRPHLEHDIDPPFVTDGRGRVVWSSTRNASGRGAAAEGRASRHSRTGSNPRIACPSPSSTFFARGHAWNSQDTQGTGEKVCGGEQGSDMD